MATNKSEMPTEKFALARWLGLDPSDCEAQEATLARVKKVYSEADVAVNRSVTELNSTPNDDSVERMLADTWTPGNRVDGLRNELSYAYQRRSVARRAVEHQNRVVEKCHNALSRQIAEKLKPQYCQLAAKIGAALEQLRAAVSAERKFCDHLFCANVQTGWNSVNHTLSSEQIDAWFENARHDGHVD